jgi:hypothetical protein
VDEPKVAAADARQPGAHGLRQGPVRAHASLLRYRVRDLRSIYFHIANVYTCSCLPGGYSTYILRTCPHATGMGISLPPEAGGHGSAIPSDVAPRFDLRLADLTLFDLAPAVPKPEPPPPDNALAPIPFTPNEFDLVVCDAHHLRLQPDNNARRTWSWTRLLVSQILLALRAVYAGGTILLKLSRIECALTARILLAFSRIAGRVETVKSKVVHKTRGTFYLLARGVRVDTSEYRKLIHGLVKLWCVMTFDGEKGHGRDITWEEQDLITPWKEVLSPNGVNQIAQLGQEIWKIQHNALHKFLQSKGIEIDSD